jgi:low affinity Fe/Cu permease
MICGNQFACQKFPAEIYEVGCDTVGVRFIVSLLLKKSNLYIMKKKRQNIFETFAGKVTKATGSTPAFLFAFGIVVVWAVSGPFFDYSETWQLVINTGTTIITFLMVFLIQKAQNKDSLAIQLKLNELVASSNKANNRLVNVEDLTEDEMNVLHNYYVKLSELTRKEESLHKTHSLIEATVVHEEKQQKKTEKTERKTTKKS